MTNKDTKRIICSHKTIIPNINEVISTRINELGGEKKMNHLVIRKQIISARISREKYGIPKNQAYYEKLLKLRQELQETR